VTAGERTVYRGIPVYPVPGAVVFPGALVHLDAGTPSRRRLVEDLLDTQGRLVLTAPVPGAPPTPRGPALREIGTLAEIVRHRRLDDGRFRLWLLALERVHLTEVPTPRPYRVVDAVVLEDVGDDLPGAGELKSELRRAVHARVMPDDDILATLDTGLLVDLLLQSLDLSPVERELALRERHVIRRAGLALAWLARQEEDPGPAPPARGDVAGA